MSDKAYEVIWMKIVPDTEMQTILSEKPPIAVDPKLKFVREGVLRLYRSRLFHGDLGWDLEEARDEADKFLRTEMEVDWLAHTVTYRSQFKRVLPAEGDILALWTLLRPITGGTGDKISFDQIIDGLAMYLSQEKKYSAKIKSNFDKLRGEFKMKVIDRLGSKEDRTTKSDPDRSSTAELARAYLYGESSHHDTDVRAGVNAHYSDQYSAAAPLVLDLAILSFKLLEEIEKILPNESKAWIADYESSFVSHQEETQVSGFGSFYRLPYGEFIFPRSSQMEERFNKHAEEFQLGALNDGRSIILRHIATGYSIHKIFSKEDYDKLYQIIIDSQ